MRKIIGKKILEKMALEKDKFINGCIANNIDADAATRLFKNIEGFATYSFNAAHSVAYSIISYRTAWLKFYYPVEFYCSVLNNKIDKQDQLVKYIHSCRSHEIAIEPPDVNRSQSLFTIDMGTIIFGLSGIKGVGEKACEELLSVRPTEGFKDISELLSAKVNVGTIKALAASGTLQNISTVNRGLLIELIDELSKYYRRVESWKERVRKWEEREKEKKVAISGGHRPPRSLPKPPPVPEPGENIKNIVAGEIDYSGDIFTKAERLRMERETLGFYISGHPLDEYPGLYENSFWDIEKIIEEATAETIVNLPVVISTLTPKRTKKGKDMAIAIIEDRTGRIEVTIFSSVWKKLKSKLEVDKVLVVSCKVDRPLSRDGETTIARLILQNAQLITEDEKDLLARPVITNIEMKLSDGAVVVYTPGPDVRFNHWQRAKAIADNFSSQNEKAVR